MKMLSTGLMSLLTLRESQVLECVVNGKSNKETAYYLGISFRTVEVHRGHIMRKLRVDNTVNLVRLVFANSLSAISDEMRPEQWSPWERTSLVHKPL